MSDIVKFVFHYGMSNVRSNEMAVDLSEFKYLEMVNAPKTWTVEQLKNWLAGLCRLNPEMYTVGVHVLWTKSTSNICWYLRPVEETSKWVGWLKGCEKRGARPVALVFPVVKEVAPPEGGNGGGGGGGGYESGQRSQAHGGGGYESEQSYCAHGRGDGYELGQSSHATGEDGYSGDADGDEESGHMKQQMEEEDTDGESDVDESDESDEDVPNPPNWIHDFSSFMNVNDGHDSSWEYHKNNVTKGTKFQDKRHLHEAIIKWAMQMQRQFKRTVSSVKYLTIECVDINCPVRVHGYLPKFDTT
jgi:hypothetical protein